MRINQNKHVRYVHAILHHIERPRICFFLAATPLRAVLSAILGSAKNTEVTTTEGRQQSLLRLRWTGGDDEASFDRDGRGGRTTKATDESGRPRRQRQHHRWQQWLCPPLETTINKRREDERGDGDKMFEEGGGTHDNRGERTRLHNNQIKTTTTMMTR